MERRPKTYLTDTLSLIVSLSLTLFFHFDTHLHTQGEATHHVTVLSCVVAAVVLYTMLSVSMAQAGPSGQ